MIPVKRCTVVCGSCHDSPDVQAHISVNTDSVGRESCGVCHATDQDLDVERMHEPY